LPAGGNVECLRAEQKEPVCVSKAPRAAATEESRGSDALTLLALARLLVLPSQEVLLHGVDGAHAAAE